MRRKKFRRNRGEHTGELTLAALVDMLVNILIFLLQLYGTDPTQASARGVELADSTSQDPVSYSVSVLVTQEMVSVEDADIGPLGDVGVDASALRAVLQREWDQARADMRPAVEGQPPEDPELVLEIDRRVPWTELRPVLKTAASVGFVKLRFVVSTVGQHPSLSAP